MWQNIKLCLSVAMFVGSLVYTHYQVDKWACYSAIEEWHEMERLRETVLEKKEETL